MGKLNFHTKIYYKKRKTKMIRMKQIRAVKISDK